MKITVLLFGVEADLAGRRQIDLQLPGESAEGPALLAALEGALPALKPRLPGCRLAVNHEFITDRQRISPGDEVALIGSVSGG